MDQVTYRYTATARRIEGWWMVQCDQCPGALSQVCSLAKAPDEHREAIAFVSGLPADQIEVDVRAVLAPELTAELEAAEGMVQQARADIEVAGQKRREVARKLAEDGLTVRDIGAVFGVSYQRAHQLLTHEVSSPTSTAT
ncbi:MAG: hypothetical protein ACRDTF_01945 [Pseudonocardiaceae bacterium]